MSEPSVRWMVAVETDDGLEVNHLDEASEALQKVWDYMFLKNVARVTVRRYKESNDGDAG